MNLDADLMADLKKMKEWFDFFGDPQYQDFV